MKQACAAALLAASGAATPSIAPLPNRSGSLRDPLLQAVGRERGDGRPAAGQDAEARRRAPCRARSPATRCRRSSQRRHQPADRRVDCPRPCVSSRLMHDFRKPEEPHRDRHEAEAVERSTCNAHRHAVLARRDVGADQAEQRHRTTIIASAFRIEPLRQHDGGDEAEHHHRHVVGGLEQQRDRGERRRGDRDHERRDDAGEERSERRHRERGAGAPLLRHRVAVEHRDQRRRLARQSAPGSRSSSRRTARRRTRPPA